MYVNADGRVLRVDTREIRTTSESETLNHEANQVAEHRVAVPRPQC